MITGYVGQTLKVTVRWQNTGTASHTFLVLGGIGTLEHELPGETGAYHDPRYWEFPEPYYFIPKVYDVEICRDVAPGVVIETVISFVVTSSDVGVWDLFGAVNESPTECYDMLIKREYLAIEHAISGAILDVTAEFE